MSKRKTKTRPQNENAKDQAPPAQGLGDASQSASIEPAVPVLAVPDEEFLIDFLMGIF